MSGQGRPQLGTVDAADIALAIAGTRWHAEITDSLVDRAVAAQLLADLGVRSVRLLTNNPAKVDALAQHGFGVTRIPLPPLTTPHNLRYLTAKRDRLGHQIDNIIVQNGRVVPANTIVPVPGEQAV